MQHPSIEIKHLSKSYGDVAALRDVNLEVGRGEVFGLIGPDGSGKTSLFRILNTLLLPDAGSATVEGFDAVRDFRQIRRIIGYMPGRFSLYQDLTVAENLRFYATVFGTTVGENYELVKDIYSRLEPFENRRAGKLSGGMKQKLALSCALIHRPAVLVLDEPTTGVDAVSRKEFWEMLIKLRRHEITILVSTPYMDEAGLCDRVALIQDGVILSVDTPAGIKMKFGGSLLEIRSSDLYRLKGDLEAFGYTGSVYLFGQNLHLTLRDDGKAGELRPYLQKMGHENVIIKTIRPTIEDCFLDLMVKS